MSEEGTTDVGKAVELLSAAATAVQIYRLAVEAKSPAVEVSVIAGDIAESTLKQARTLLRRDGEGNDAAPGEGAS